MDSLFDDFELDIQKVSTGNEPDNKERSTGIVVGIGIAGIVTGIITDSFSCSYGPAGCN